MFGILPARALENKVYVAVPNRAEKQAADNERVKFTGRSLWLNGSELAKVGEEADDEIFDG